MKRTEYAEIHLGYFKQGDDLDYFLSDNGPVEAFLCHSDLMISVSEHLKKIANVIKEYQFGDLTINACGHHISITGPEECIKKLVDLKLATYMDEDLWEESYESYCDSE